MAEYRAAIFGTELDNQNCSFYLKVGACRHGSECIRMHLKPTFSQTVLLKNFYLNPCHKYNENGTVQYNMNTITNEEFQEHFDNFYEDVFIECEEKYGRIISMNVCINICTHLLGNVYIKFFFEHDAEKAVIDLNNRWFGGRPIFAELSPVTDFNKAMCNQQKDDQCIKKGLCNFLHIKRVSAHIERFLYNRNTIDNGWLKYNRYSSRASTSKSMKLNSRDYRSRNRSRSRSRNRSRSRSRNRSRSRSRNRSRSRSRNRSRSRSRNRSRNKEYS